MDAKHDPIAALRAAVDSAHGKLAKISDDLYKAITAIEAGGFQERIGHVGWALRELDSMNSSFGQLCGSVKEIETDTGNHVGDDQ